MSSRRGVTLFLLFVSLPAAAFGLPAKEQKPLSSEEIIKRWEDGPVRYLMSYKEEEALKELKTIPELERFITDFWARRDPSPGTVENEFRRIYWERVVEANKRYRDSTMPGWKTDRGKVFILLGEPFDVQRDESPSVAVTPRDNRAPDRDSGVRGIERWTYHRKYTIAADPEFVVAFVRDQSLDWKLSSNPDLLKPDFPGVNTLDSRNPTFGGVENRGAIVSNRGAAAGGVTGGQRATMTEQIASASPPAFNTSALANWDLGLEMAVPSNTEEVLALVTARQFVTGFAATPRFEFFRAQDGSTFVNVGALLNPKDLYGDASTGSSDLRVHASLVPDGDPEHPRYASNESSPVGYDLAKGPPPGGVVDVWTGVAVPPGKYKVTLAIEDSLTGHLGRGTSEIDVPNLSAPGPLLSSLVLATSLPEPGGKTSVPARSSAVFRRSEDFAIYFQVYGLQESGGEEKFDVTYRFYRETAEGPQPIGKPISFAERTGAEQGWSFPLAKWPPARYRIEVTVATPSGKSTTAQAPFEVVE